MTNRTTSTWRTYYYLTKPGIVRGNLVVAVAGFLLAADGRLLPGRLIALICGTALVMASACVFNNYVDRHIDCRMDRTKTRALVTGAVSGPQAIFYATVLGVGGTLILVRFTNLLTALIGLGGTVVYVMLYGVAKRRSTLGTVVGSLAGATPPVAGYCAVTNRLDMAAGLLFGVLVCWQMPHFYAIAIFRSQDYAAADIPVLPLKKGIGRTKLYIMLYIAAFTICAALLTIFNYTGYVYLFVMLALGLYWLWRGWQGYQLADSKRWAKQMFGLSLVVIMLFSLLLGLNFCLP